MVNKKQIHIIDIAETSDDTLKSALAAAGLPVTSYSFSQVGPELFAEDQPDLILVRLTGNRDGGLACCRNIRAAFPQCALCLIHAGLSEWEESIALELGADAVIRRPCESRRILAQIRALLRQRGRNPAHRLELLPGSRTVKVGSQSIPLTAAEFDLLDVLAQHLGSVVSREAISRHLRGLSYNGLDRTIDLRIARIRRKLGDNALHPLFIRTVRGEGYMLMSGDI